MVNKSLLVTFIKSSSSVPAAENGYFTLATAPSSLVQSRGALTSAKRADKIEDGYVSFGIETLRCAGLKNHGHPDTGLFKEAL